MAGPGSGSCESCSPTAMAGDDWTVVGSKGRPRKPRRAAAGTTARASHSPAAGTRNARRSAEEPADGEPGEGSSDGKAAADSAHAEPLPGWGSCNGHGAVNGRAGRVKRRQAWVERSPAERVSSLQRDDLCCAFRIATTGMGCHATCTVLPGVLTKAAACTVAPPTMPAHLDKLPTVSCRWSR